MKNITKTSSKVTPLIVPKKGLVHESDKSTDLICEDLHKLIDQIFISRTHIKNKVIDLASQISADYKEAGIDEVYLIAVLKGAAMFAMDLARAIYDLHTISLKLDYIKASSYGCDTTTSGEVSIIGEIDDVQGKHVLLVEDIADTGLTLRRLKSCFIEEKKAESLKICVLLDKEERRYDELKGFEIDYVGFKIPDMFVAGYGIDCAELFREMPFIIVINEEYFAESE